VTLATGNSPPTFSAGLMS